MKNVSQLDRNPRSKKPSGFSLVELLVVITVIGILASIALPSLSNIFENSRDNGNRRNAQNIASAYNGARMMGVSLPEGSDMNAVLMVLSSGVSGVGPLSTVKFQLSSISPEQLVGATEFLRWEPNSGILQYTGAARPVNN